MLIQGTVTDVTGSEFTINSGSRLLTVETEDMLYDPLDDEGYQQIEKGDRVSVSGDLDTDVFGLKELEAHSIVTLEEAS